MSLKIGRYSCRPTISAKIERVLFLLADFGDAEQWLVQRVFEKKNRPIKIACHHLSANSWVGKLSADKIARVTILSGNCIARYYRRIKIARVIGLIYVPKSKEKLQPYSIVIIINPTYGKMNEWADLERLQKPTNTAITDGGLFSATSNEWCDGER